VVLARIGAAVAKEKICSGGDNSGLDLWVPFSSREKNKKYRPLGQNLAVLKYFQNF